MDKEDHSLDYYKRSNAVRLAVDSGAKNVVAVAGEIYNFLTAGNAGAELSKPAARGAKADKASAQGSEGDAPKQSSDKPAASTAETATKTSPSEAASGFAADGAEITKADLIAAATKFVSADGKSEADLVAVFANYGASKLSEVEPSGYAAVIADLALPVSGAFD